MKLDETGTHFENAKLIEQVSLQDLKNATNDHRLDINLTKGADIATFLHQAIRFPPKHLGLGENMGSRHFNLSIGYTTTCCSPLIKKPDAYRHVTPQGWAVKLAPETVMKHSAHHQGVIFFLQFNGGP